MKRKVPLITDDHWLNTDHGLVLWLRPGGAKSPLVYHQYGGLACLQYEAFCKVTEVVGPLRYQLLELNEAMCADGWGDKCAPKIKKKIEALLGREITNETAEGLIYLADGTLIAMENCD